MVGKYSTTEPKAIILTLLTKKKNTVGDPLSTGDQWRIPEMLQYSLNSWLGCSSVLECVLSMCEALSGFLPPPKNIKKDQALAFNL
jgi:hypothetical protein